MKNTMKNTMKRLVSFLLALLMLMLTACEAQPVPPPETEATDTAKPEETEDKGETPVKPGRKTQLRAMLTSITEDKTISDKLIRYLEALFDVLDPKYMGEAYTKAIEAKDYEAAVKACADYFRNKPDFAGETGFSAVGSYGVESADKSVNGIFTSINIEYAFPKGEVDYHFNPTSENGPWNPEWVFQFNRHGEWGNLARTYIGTGDEKYAKAFNDLLTRWLVQTSPTDTDTWRTIECGLRLAGPWLIAFDGFKKSASIDDITLLLLVAAMHRQSTYLSRAYSGGGNWLMMELRGNYSFTSMFPELTDSEAAKKDVENRLTAEVAKQVLPDGMQTELTPDYHFVTFTSALNVCSLAQSLGQPVDEELLQILKGMINSSILLSTPAFTQPSTNDCYTQKTSAFLPSIALSMLGTLPEYSYVLSNRAEGKAPEGITASAFLEYAGYIAMRSDWGADAAYMCFDVGPLGTAHAHQDKLNIIMFKGDQQLLFDDGGGQYDASAQRTYATSAYGHNTVLVDGRGQNRTEPTKSSEPIDAGWITNDVFDYATGTYDGVFGNDKSATHKREVRFCKPGFFVVKDTLTPLDGKAHDYEILFQLDTTKVHEIAEYENGVMSDFGGKYELVMIPLDQDAANVEVKCVSGSTDPVRGWYVGRNGETVHEAMTVSRTVEDVTEYEFVTLLFPVKAGDALPQVTKKDGGLVTVVFEGQTYEIDLNHLNA